MASSPFYWKPTFKSLGDSFGGTPDDSRLLTGDHPFRFGRHFISTCLGWHCSCCQGLVAGVRGEVGSPHKVQEVDLQMLSSLGIKLTSDQGNYRVQSDHGQCQGSEADSGS